MTLSKVGLGLFTVFFGVASLATTEASPSKKAIEQDDAPEEICAQDAQNAALVVIDMQPHFVSRHNFHMKNKNSKKTQLVLAAQISAINNAKRHNIPIVFIEYDNGSCGQPECENWGTTDSRLKSVVAAYEDVHYIKKDQDGIFDETNSYREKMADFVKKRGIGTLIVAGANGGACVYESIKGALKNKCNVVAFSKGIADFNYPDFIYPYSGKYSWFEKPKCENCSFVEASSVEELSKFMISKPIGRNGATQQSNRNEVGR